MSRLEKTLRVKSLRISTENPGQRKKASEFAICVVLDSLDNRDGFLGTFYDEPDVEPDSEPLLDIV
jgi:hypothetical protein